MTTVNYASRDFGIKRHTPVAEALLKCPQLRLVHVPTYSVQSIGETGESVDNTEIVAIPRYSDEMPAYRSDGTRLPPNPPDPASNKACLEPYRQASMAIFRLLRDWCSTFGDGVVMEKGGLDEAFIDITEEVEQQLIDEFNEKYTMLRDELADVGDDELEVEAIENLKLYDPKWIEDDLDFTGLGETAVVKEQLGDDQEEEDIVERMRKSLGKLRIWKGAQLAKRLRARLRLDLNFIASIGIASNKMLAKLVSAIYKPDMQTRIEPDGVGTFMRRVPFEKIRMMGGKMGKSVLRTEDNERGDGNEEDCENNDNDHADAEAENNSSVMAADLWPLGVSELADRVGDRQTAIWIHQLIRGLDPSPVTPRSLTKSFMSAKSFRPSVRDWPELHDWVVVLVGELWSRMAEERESSGRWPGTITVHYKAFSKQQQPQQQQQQPQGKWSNSGAVSKSAEFPYASSIPSQATRSDFLASVFKLLRATSALFPMSRLAVSVSNFKGVEADGKARATRVDQFFKKLDEEGEGVAAANSSFESAGLDRVFAERRAAAKTENAVAPVKSAPKKKSVFELLLVASAKTNNIAEAAQSTQNTTGKNDPAPVAKKPKTTEEGILKFFKQSAGSFKCPEALCKFACPSGDSKGIQEHSDHHFAIKLSRAP